MAYEYRCEICHELVTGSDEEVLACPAHPRAGVMSCPVRVVTRRVRWNATRAHDLASEMRALAKHNDYGGRYQQIERELCGEICSSRWTPSKGQYLTTYRLPTGHAVRNARRAVAAWTDL